MVTSSRGASDAGAARVLGVAGGDDPESLPRFAIVVPRAPRTHSTRRMPRTKGHRRRFFGGCPVDAGAESPLPSSGAPQCGQARASVETSFPHSRQGWMAIAGPSA
jgi:hypothetical protein